MKFTDSLAVPNTVVQYCLLDRIIDIKDAKKTDDIYFLVGVPSEKKDVRVGDIDIKHKKHFFLDLDLRKEYGGSTEDIIALGAYFKGLMDESIHFKEWRYIIFTGNGLHIYFTGDTVNVTENHGDAYQKICEMFHKECGELPDVQCKNPARIARLVGTYNNKNKDDPQKVEILFSQDKKSPLVKTLESYKPEVKELKKPVKMSTNDTMPVEDVIDFAKREPVKRMCDIFGIEYNRRNEIKIGGEFTSAKINEKENYINRFSGKGGGGDFISLLEEVFDINFKDAVDMVANKCLGKDVKWNKDDFYGIVSEFKKDLTPKVFTWGTPVLDFKIAPIKRGNYIVLVGETGRGKTTFMHYVARKNAENGIKTVYLSLEMTTDELIDRTARNYAGVTKDEYRRMDRDPLPDHKQEMYNRKVKELYAQDGIKILGFPKGKGKTIENIFKYLKGEEFDLLVLDNFGRIDKGDTINVNSATDRVIDKICDFASITQRPVILVHHFRKASGDTKKQFRSIDSIAGSAKICNDSDITIQIARSDDMETELGRSTLMIKEEKTRACEKEMVQTIYFKHGDFSDECPQLGF